MSDQGPILRHAAQTATPTFILSVKRKLRVQRAEAPQRVKDERVGVVEEVLR